MSGKEQLFRDKLLEFKSELDKNPNHFKRYEIEAALLKSEIAKQGLNKNHSFFRNITNAVMEIGYFRVREILKNGWICGTYMSRVIAHHECLVRYLFLEDELEKLIMCCANNEMLDQHQEEIIQVLLSTIPRLIIHRRPTLDDL